MVNLAALALVASLPISGQPAYTTMNEAATAALTAVVATNTKTEEAGAITQCADGFHYTSAVGSDEQAKVSDIHIMIQAKCKFVALYHTHPALTMVTESLSNYFSDVDVKLADDLNVPSYIMDVAANKIHLYVPHVSHKEWITPAGTSQKLHVSAGEVL